MNKLLFTGRLVDKPQSKTHGETIVTTLERTAAEEVVRTPVRETENWLCAPRAETLSATATAWPSRASRPASNRCANKVLPRRNRRRPSA